MNQFISYYENSKQVQESERITIRAFMKSVIKGKWKDYADKARRLQGDKLSMFKRTVPAVTFSGTFRDGRKDTDLIKHSWFIAMDVDSGDNVDPLSKRKALKKDPFVCGYFVSLSGKGLAIVFKIKPTTHRDAYESISSYLLEKYGLVCDPMCKNVSRIRFVSYDPDGYWEFNKLQFNKIEKMIKEVPDDAAGYDLEEIEELVEVAEEKRKDLMKGYHAWYKIGQALAIFGEPGRELFHRLSKINKKEYDEATADRQYDSCLDQEAKGMRDVRVGPATIFYIAKENGVLLKPGPTYVSSKNR